MVHQVGTKPFVAGASEYVDRENPVEAPLQVVAHLLLLADWFSRIRPASPGRHDRFQHLRRRGVFQFHGSYGYAWNCGTRGEAEQAALARCTASDARIVGWVQGDWLVLAIGENNSYGIGWEYGDGATNTVAQQRAIDEYHARGDEVRTLICLCSGDIDPVILR
jgi:hypothetical protein